MLKAIRSMRISSKLNLVFLLCLLAVTAAQLALRYSMNQGLTIFITVAFTLAAFGVMWFYTHRVVTRSLEKIMAVGRRWYQGDLSVRVDLHTGDEFQQLGETFNTLSTGLNESLKGLEVTVAERTLILQRRAKQVQAAAEVGRAAVTIRDLDVLLPEVTRLISGRFDIYHVGIFLLEPGGEYVYLRAANSEGGKQLILDGHKLKVGAQGIVGYVASKGEPRISLDVGSDDLHYKNPALPDTRSEMALPLSVGGKILGVLDVQSTRSGAFTDEDASILQLMADQIAIAIDNAHLLAESKEALETSRRAYGELSQQIWNKTLASKPDISFLATKDDATVQITQRPWDPELVVACESGEIVHADPNAVAIPIKLRDQVIGVVRLQKSEHEKDWSPEEVRLMEAIAEQTSIALESARLYEDTQRRAERERLAGEITAKIRATNDPQDILKVAARELRQALRASQAQVMVKSNEKTTKPAVEKDNGNNNRELPEAFLSEQ